MTRDQSLALWACLAAAGIVCALISWRRPAKVVTVRQLLRRLTLRPPAAVVTFLAWMWVGWHFFAR